MPTAEYMLPSNRILFPEAPANGFEHLKNDVVTSVDVVVVGAGPGGGSAARVLAAAGLTVMVVESGPRRSRFRPNYPNVAKYHMQENGSIVSKGNAMMPIAAGKGVGGSTLINSALSFRAPDHVLHSWSQELEDDKWGSASMNEAYDEISKLIGVGITREAIAGKNNAIIVDGLKKLGLDGGFAPRSTPGCAGCGICYYGCPSGGKASTNLTLLPRAVRSGATIQAETEIREIIVKKGRAVGVIGVAIDPETGKEGGRLTVHADTVILAAGALGTPKLLWQCGLASSMGRNVGEHLSVHPGSTLIGIYPEKVEMWKGATQGAYFHPPTLPGVLPHTFSAPPEACLLAAGFIGDTFQEGLALLPYMCGMLVMVSDKGNGQVRATKQGTLDVRYNFTEEDVQRIKQGLVAVSEVLLAGGAKDLRAPIHGVGVVQSPQELERALHNRKIQDFTLYAAHPMGTCRMSKNKENGVVDPNGQSHHIQSLYITDASIFPSSLGVNPQLSTMACSMLIARTLTEQI